MDFKNLFIYIIKKLIRIHIYYAGIFQTFYIRSYKNIYTYIFIQVGQKLFSSSSSVELTVCLLSVSLTDPSKQPISVRARRLEVRPSKINHLGRLVGWRGCGLWVVLLFSLSAHHSSLWQSQSESLSHAASVQYFHQGHETLSSIHVWH